MNTGRAGAAMMDNEQRRKHAAALAHNPLWQQLCEEIQATAVKSWSSTTDVDKQLESWATYRAVNRMQQAIKGILAEAQQ